MLFGVLSGMVDAEVETSRPAGSTYRSPRMVWRIQMSTVRRKLPTITVRAMSMPTETMSAATTTLVKKLSTLALEELLLGQSHAQTWNDLGADTTWGELRQTR